MSLRPLPVKGTFRWPIDPLATSSRIRSFMKKRNQSLVLKVVLAMLIIALIAVVGYIILREYQYGVSESYYESLRNIGLLKGGVKL